MDLTEKLAADLKTAIKSGQAVKKETIRALRGAIHNAEIDAGRSLSAEEILTVIDGQAKQRRDSIDQYQKANRADLVQQEAQELAIIETYLPQQLSDEEIEARAKAVIAELGVTGPKGMGPVMQRLTGELKGVAGGKRISRIVRVLLAR
ncbi:MAG: GatB/YqeY domain-containing protein [Anaerolineae bacterium]